MGRSRSRSYSPRSRSPGPRRRRHGEDAPPRRDSRDAAWRRSPPCSLLVRNIPRDARPEEIRIPFEKFGVVKDVYLPKDYYSGEPRGFGFVQFMNPDEAQDAKHHMDHQMLGGREITVVFAEENRKKPSEMRVKSRVSSRGSGGWGSSRHSRRSPPRSPRRYRSYSRSRSPRPRRHHSARAASDRYERSPSPHHDARNGRDGRDDRDARSASPRGREVRRRPSPGVADRGRSPEGNGHHHAPRRSYSRSPSPVRRHSRSRSYSRGRD